MIFWCKKTMVTYQVLARKQPWKWKLILMKFSARCWKLLVNQISTRLCILVRVYKTLLLEPKKAFPAKTFIQINNTFAMGSKKLSIFLRACIQACNFCTHFNCVYGDGLIGAFANKITKIIRIWGKQSVNQFLKSKSTFENNIYRTVEFSQVL